MDFFEEDNVRIEALLFFALSFFVGMVLVDKLPESESINVVLGYGLFFSWLSMPYLMYKDILDVPDSISWSPNKVLYTVASAVPYLNVAVVLTYISRRHHINYSMSHENIGVYRSDWWKGALAGIMMFFAVLILPTTMFMDGSGNTTLVGDLAISLISMGWVLIPISISFDRTFLKKKHDLDQGKALMYISLIPVVSVVAGMLYIIERHQELEGEDV